MDSKALDLIRRRRIRANQMNQQQVLLVRRLMKIFKANGWNFNDGDDDRDAEVFDRTLNLLSRLDPPAQDLVFFQLERFAQIELENYMPIAKKIAINQKDKISNKRIVIVPVKNSKDHAAGKAKSGEMMTIIFREAFNRGCKSVDAYANVANERIREIAKDPAAIIVGVDDFIGSGKTAAEFLKLASQQLEIPTQSIYLSALCAMQSGLDHISGLAADIFVGKIVQRGISDEPSLSNEQRASQTEIMKNIEKKLKISSDYEFGFCKSEALVKMMRTPNNTFPVYWCSKATPDLDWPCPFPR